MEPERDTRAGEAGSGADREAGLLRLLKGVDSQLVSDHLARMDAEYLRRYSDKEVARHLAAIAELGPEHSCRLLWHSLGRKKWELIVVAFDHQGLFSIIAGTMASFGLNIEKGEVWTYADSGKETSVPKGGQRYDFRLRRYISRPGEGKTGKDGSYFLKKKKIVDVFTIKSLNDEPDWESIERRLDGLVSLLLLEKKERARKSVSRRVIDYLSKSGKGIPQRLFPIQVKVDNKISPKYTVMDIEAEDTQAFLYLFTNALSMQGVDIHNIHIGTKKGKVEDRFLVTDSQGAKIVSPERIDELKFIVALVKQFSHLLVHSPDPDMALNNFEKLVERIYEDRKRTGSRSWKMLDITEQPVLEAMARLFGMSDFLWEDFLRLQYENLLPVFADLEALDNYKDKAAMWSECEMELLRAKSYEEAVERLNQFKDREMFRIDMRHILDKVKSFTEFSRELTDLAEVVIESAYRICHSTLRERYGNPMCEDGSPCRFAVFALGKAGGRELGYASDIELLFVHSGSGNTAGRESISNTEYFEKLAQKIIQTIKVKRQGIFELDLRFRPFGNQGPLSNTLKQFEEYYNGEGRAWDFERQCLVRLRFIAGDEELGRKVLELRDRFVYSSKPLDLAELLRLRARQLGEFVKPGTWNVKFSEGGLVEIEYHVQRLVIHYGAGDQSVRCTGTREELKALHRGGYVSREEFESLMEAHDFLRRLINALRILRGNARDLVIPERNSEEFLFLARRMGYPAGEESRLAGDLVHHRTAVVRLVGRTV